MLSWDERVRLKSLISCTVLDFCRDGLVPRLDGEFCVDGLIGITLGREELVVCIKKRLHGVNGQCTDDGTRLDEPLICKRRKRRHGSGTSPHSEESDFSSDRSDTPTLVDENSNKSYPDSVKSDYDECSTPSTIVAENDETELDESDETSFSDNDRESVTSNKNKTDNGITIENVLDFEPVPLSIIDDEYYRATHPTIAESSVETYHHNETDEESADDLTKLDRVIARHAASLMEACDADLQNNQTGGVWESLYIERELSACTLDHITLDNTEGNTIFDKHLETEHREESGISDSLSIGQNTLQESPLKFITGTETESNNETDGYTLHDQQLQTEDRENSGKPESLSKGKNTLRKLPLKFKTGTETERNNQTASYTIHDENLATENSEESGISESLSIGKNTLHESQLRLIHTTEMESNNQTDNNSIRDEHFYMKNREENGIAECLSKGQNTCTLHPSALEFVSITGTERNRDESFNNSIYDEHFDTNVQHGKEAAILPDSSHIAQEELYESQLKFICEKLTDNNNKTDNIIIDRLDTSARTLPQSQMQFTNGDETATENHNNTDENDVNACTHNFNARRIQTNAEQGDYDILTSMEDSSIFQPYQDPNSMLDADLPSCRFQFMSGTQTKTSNYADGTHSSNILDYNSGMNPMFTHASCNTVTGYENIHYSSVIDWNETTTDEHTLLKEAIANKSSLMESSLVSKQSDLDKDNNVHDNFNHLDISRRESDISRKESNISHNESDISHTESDIGHKELDVSHKESDVSHKESDVSHRESDIGHKESDVSHKESDVSHMESDMSHRGTDISCIESDISHKDLDMSHKESGTSHIESDKSHKGSDISHIESEISCKEKDISHNESDMSHIESDIIHTESDTSHKESDISHIESDISHKESEISHMESNTSHKASDISHKESDISHKESDLSHKASSTEPITVEMESSDPLTTLSQVKFSRETARKAEITLCMTSVVKVKLRRLDLDQLRQSVVPEAAVTHSSSPLEDCCELFERRFTLCDPGSTFREGAPTIHTAATQANQKPPHSLESVKPNEEIMDENRITEGLRSNSSPSASISLSESLDSNENVKMTDFENQRKKSQQTLSKKRNTRLAVKTLKGKFSKLGSPKSVRNRKGVTKKEDKLSTKAEMYPFSELLVEDKSVGMDCKEAENPDDSSQISLRQPKCKSESVSSNTVVESIGMECLDLKKSPNSSKMSPNGNDEIVTRKSKGKLAGEKVSEEDENIGMKYPKLTRSRNTATKSKGSPKATKVQKSAVKVTSGKEKILVECAECGSQFMNKSELSSHFTVHQNPETNENDSTESVKSSKNPKGEFTPKLTSGCDRSVEMECAEFENENDKLQKSSRKLELSESLPSADDRNVGGRLLVKDKNEIERTKFKNQQNKPKKSSKKLVKLSNSKNRSVVTEVDVKKSKLSPNVKEVDLELDSLSKDRSTRVECSECGRGFTSKKDLSLHLRVHTGEFKDRSTRVECSECGRGFTSKKDLSLHLRVHTGESLFQCESCGKRYTRLGALRKHVATHRADAQRWQCAECERWYGSRADLTRHARRHGGERPYQCTHCGRCFVDQGALARHVRTHTGERAHTCGECGKGFLDAGGLTAHTRTHTGVRPHPCLTCGKRFDTGVHLRRHELVHTGVRPHVCGVCGKAFQFRDGLRKHSKTHGREGEVI